MNRRRLSTIAALALTACPALAAQPAIRCADLGPESFTDAQYAALERDAPVLHAYLESGSFHGLDARQRFRVVSQATTGAETWGDVTVPEPFHDHDAVAGDAMLSSYATACDSTLGAYVGLSERIEQAAAMDALGDALFAKSEDEGDLKNCTDIEKCQHDWRECMKDARAARDGCIKAANKELDDDLDACREEYDSNVQDGMNATLAATVLVACNGAANTKHWASLAECEVDFVTDGAVCAAEHVACMTRAINPL